MMCSGSNLQNSTSLTLKQRSTKNEDTDTLMFPKLYAYEYQCNIFNCFYAENQLNSESKRAAENQWSSIVENRHAFSHISTRADSAKNEYSSSATSLLDFATPSSCEDQDHDE